MKSKELKFLRKNLERVNRIGREVLDPIVLAASIERPQQQQVTLHYTTATEVLAKSKSNNNRDKDNNTDVLDECLDLFEANMADQYRQSSWGLKLDEKREELSHKHARFVLLNVQQNEAGGNEENTLPGSNNTLSSMIGYCHFRFEYDDEDDPQCAALYVYELQLRAAHQRHGWGKRIMQLMDDIARAVELPKIMLTVFRNNSSAMQFYTRALQYTIDENSPSQHGDVNCDYEILSKAV